MAIFIFNFLKRGLSGYSVQCIGSVIYRYADGEKLRLLSSNRAGITEDRQRL